FCQKKDATFVVMPNVGSCVQKMVSRNRPAQPCTQSPAESKSHPVHRERDETDVRFAFAKIQGERHLPLKRRAIHFVMKENCALPVRVKQRFKRTRQQSSASGFARFAFRLSLELVEHSVVPIATPRIQPR